MSIDKSDKIIFMISGGIGKNIMATAVVKATKNNYPDKKIVVATAWPEVWAENPNVTKIYNVQKESFLYKNEIANSDTFFFAAEPYLQTDFLYRRVHLIEAWCSLLGVPYQGELPELFFNKKESSEVQNKLPQDKPLFFIQTSGGAENQEFPISWMRDMPLEFAGKVVQEMNSKGYRTIHLRRPNQYSIPGADFINFTLREMLCALQFSDKRLLIDSVAQHAAAAQNLPSVVTWVGNKPEIFGYEMHENVLPKIQPEFRHHIDSYLEPYNITGILHECPYGTNDLFDFDEVMKRLD